VEVVVVEEAAAESELRVFTHDDGHMGGIGEGCRGARRGRREWEETREGSGCCELCRAGCEGSVRPGFYGIGWVRFCTNPAHYKQLLIHSNRFQI
jgi:hypothetical protein